MTNTLRLSGPADLLAVVPHMLGYQPQHSLVAIALHAYTSGRRVGLVERLDMPSEGEAVEAAEALTAPMVTEAPAGVVLIGYERTLGEAAVPLEVLAGLLLVHGLPVVHVLAVHADHWHFLGRADSASQGHPMPPADSAPAVEMIAAGSCPAQSREALADRLAPGHRVDAVAGECERLRAAGGQITAEAAASAWAAVLTGPSPVEALPDGTLALAALSLHADYPPLFRDCLLGWMAPGMMRLDLVEGPVLATVREMLPLPWVPTGETTQSQDSAAAVRSALDRLMVLCASIPDQHAAPPLTVLANLAWWSGDGTITRLALSRALAASPDYRLAALLDRLVDLRIRTR